MNEFKASTLTIGWRAQEISETLLVYISDKRVYRDLEFEEDQQEHRTAVQQKLMSLHQDVVAIMTNSYEVFKNDGPEVGGPGVKALGLGGPLVPSELSLGSSLLLLVGASQMPGSTFGCTQPSVLQTFFLWDSESYLCL